MVDIINIQVTDIKFATKLQIEYDPLAVGCLSEWHANRTLDFYQGQACIDTRVYEQAIFVKEQLRTKDSVT